MSCKLGILKTGDKLKNRLGQIYYVIDYLPNSCLLSFSDTAFPNAYRTANGWYSRFEIEQEYKRA